MSNVIERLEALAEKATPGPWRWGGNVDTRLVYLSTVYNGRVMVMTFDRWGMQGAQPTFWRKVAEDVARGWGGRPVKTAECAVREVEYRGDIDRLDHPDAEIIVAAVNALPDLLKLARAANYEHDCDTGEDICPICEARGRLFSEAQP